MSATEDAATAAFVSELVAEGMVERQAEALVVQHNGRELMAEIKLFDISPPDELCNIDGCTYTPHPPYKSHSWGGRVTR